MEALDIPPTLLAPRRPGDRVKRREFITLLGGAAAWPLAVRAQQAAVPVVGFVSGRRVDASAHHVAAFRKVLNGTGYVEGQNVMVEYHWLDGQYDRLPAVMDDLVRRRGNARMLRSHPISRAQGLSAHHNQA